MIRLEQSTPSVPALKPSAIALRSAERRPGTLRLQLVQHPHHVIGRQLDEHRRHLRVQPRRSSRPRASSSPPISRVSTGLSAPGLDTTPSAIALVNDSSFWTRLLNHRVFRLVVEPACARHLTSSYKFLTICLSAVSRSCSAPRPPLPSSSRRSPAAGTDDPCTRASPPFPAARARGPASTA